MSNASPLRSKSSQKVLALLFGRDSYWSTCSMVPISARTSNPPNRPRSSGAPAALPPRCSLCPPSSSGAEAPAPSPSRSPRGSMRVALGPAGGAVRGGAERVDHPALRALALQRRWRRRASTLQPFGHLHPRHPSDRSASRRCHHRLHRHRHRCRMMYSRMFRMQPGQRPCGCTCQDEDRRKVPQEGGRGRACHGCLRQSRCCRYCSCKML